MSVNVGEAIGYLDLDTSGFTKGFKSALQELQAFKSSTSTMGDKVTALGSAMTKAGSTMTKNVTLPLVGLGTVAVATTTKFESAMSQVQATMGITTDATSKLEGQTVNTMDALGDLAKEMGASTKFSATEAAEAINNMAMAGYDVEQIYQALPQVLSLASAGALDLDYATQLVANGLNVMGLETSDAAEMADKLAVTASSAYGSVSDFGEGILIAGGQAKLANVSLTDTLTALGILGDNGISASEGGTALRNTLKNLYTPTTDAAKALEELGVTTSNSDGTLRDFQDVLKDLGGSLDGLTDEQRVQYMSRIFDTRTISAANALLGNCTDRWDELSSSIDGAEGAAERMADTQLDNLSGQLTILKSSLEGAAIAFGELLLPLIKKITSALQGFVDWVNNLSDSQKALIVKIAEILAVMGPVLLIGGKLIKGTVKIVSTVGKIIPVVRNVVAVVKFFLGAFNPVVLVIGTVIAALVALYKNNEDFRNLVEQVWSAIKNTVSNVVDALVTFFTVTIPEAFNACIEGIKNFAENVAIFFTETIPEKISELVDWFASLPEKIGYAIGFAIGTLARWIVDLWNTVKTGIPKVIKSVVDFFAQLPSKIWTTLLNVIAKLKNFVSNAIQWAKTEIPKFISSVVNFFLGLPAKIWNALLSALSRIRSWGSQMISWARSAIPQVVSTIVSFFSQLPSKLISIGGNLVTGLWNGISNKVDWVIGKIKGFGNSILQGIKDAFGIASPSKKTKEMGKFLVEGLSKGIEDSEDEALDSVDSLAEGLLGGLISLTEKLSNMFGVVSNPFEALEKQKEAYDSITQSILEQIEALKELRSLQEAFYIGNTLLYGEEALEAFNGHSMAPERYSRNPNSNVNGPKVVYNSYTFNSPEAVNPTTAAKLMKQTAQQMAMDS